MRRLATLLFAVAGTLHADGGAVVLHQEGPLTLTVFVSPTPPRAGTLDVSVLVQQPESAEPVLNADVWLKFTKDGSDVAAQARRGVGQNKLLYVASVPLDAPGSWHCTATAHWGVRKVQASGLLAVGVPAASIRTYSLYLVLPFLCIGILAVHQWRVWSMGQTRTLATSRGATSPGAE